jgi:Tol biopolymer transport system component
MNNLQSRIIATGWLCLVFCAVTCVSASSPVQLVSTASPFTPSPAGGSGDSSASFISADSRFVLFLSDANNLVTNDDNGKYVDVFLRDLTNGTTTLVSLNLTGVGGGNGNSISPAASADGRYVVFESDASNLVSNDTNGVSDVFVRDLQSGTTALVSVSSNGPGVGNGPSTSPIISADGRYVAFVSAAGNLVANDTNGVNDAFIRDLQSGTTALVSVNASGNAGGNDASDSPTMTPDGRWIVFVSKATNLVAAVTNNQGEIYARDLVGGNTVWVGTNVATIMAGVNSQSHPINSYNPVISDDGNYVAFKSIGAAQLVLRHNLQTGATDLVSTNTIGNTIGFDDPSGPDMTADGRFIAYTAQTGPGTLTYSSVYLWDAQTAANVLVSANLSGTISSNTFSDTPAVSADGRFVTFVSDAVDLATNAEAGTYQVYIRDMVSGTTKLVSADVNGGVSGDTGGAIPTISADGRYVAFDSFDGDYVANDNNAAFDVFVRDTATDTTDLVSQSTPTLQSLTANNLSSVGANSLSADGRFVAFTSLADNIVTNDANGNQDVFVGDLQTGTNMLVSVNSSGTGTANSFSGNPVVNADGRFVVFVSSATDLVPGQTNRIDNIYVRDLQSGAIQLVSVSTNGTGGNAASSAPAISADGRYVAFLSQAGNLVPNDLNNSVDVFWRDLETGATTSATTAGSATSFTMSADGRRIACVAGAQARLLVWNSQSRSLIYSNISPAVPPFVLSADGNLLIYQVGSLLLGRDLNANTGVTIGSTIQGGKTTPQIDSHGRFVAYVSGTSNSPGFDTNNVTDVFLYDLQTATTTLISFNLQRTASGNGASDSPSISADGRFVTYRSAASDLVTGDDNNQTDVFVFDRLTGTNTLVSVNQTGSASGNDRSSGPVISADGSTIVFRSVASDLDAGDFNGTQDVFSFRLAYPAFVDSDSDGMDDNWERAYFGDLSHAGSADSDGDGLSDLMEYKAGTNPIDASSSLNAQASVASLTGQATVTWDAAPGRSYRLEYKNDLSETNWTAAPAGVMVNGLTATCSDNTPATGNQRFYRIVVVE